MKLLLDLNGVHAKYIQHLIHFQLTGTVTSLCSRIHISALYSQGPRDRAMAFVSPHTEDTFLPTPTPALCGCPSNCPTPLLLYLSRPHRPHLWPPPLALVRG